MPMSAWIKIFSKTYSGITKESVWRIWTDVHHWPQWHGDLESCTMEGAFHVGNYFMSAFVIRNEKIKDLIKD